MFHTHKPIAKPLRKDSFSKIYLTTLVLFFIAITFLRFHLKSANVLSNTSSLCITNPNIFTNIDQLNCFQLHPSAKLSIPLHLALICNGSIKKKSNSPYTLNIFSSLNLTSLILLLLAGDVELNPGPKTFKMCTLNIRSLTNPLHYTAIADLAQTHKINLFSLTETWITSSNTLAELSDITPPGFTLISTPRPAPSTNLKNKIVGGGTAFLLQGSSTILSTSSQIFKSFEMSSITLKLVDSKLTVFNIYRNHYLPRSTQRNNTTPFQNYRELVPFTDFINDFNTFISIAATTPHDFVITGDFNIHMDNSSDPHAQFFLSTLENANLSQHVSFPTHRDNHTLDLVITTKDSTLSPQITYSQVSPSDHFPVFTTLTISSLPPPPLIKTTYRCIKSIDIGKFIRDILVSRLITHPPVELSELVDCYNLTLSTILNYHAPLKYKLVRPKPPNLWFTPAIQKLKSARRHLEQIWITKHTALDLQILKSATNHYHAAIIKAKKVYNSALISSSLANPKKLWNTINNLLHKKNGTSLPTATNPKLMPELFATFFSDKIKNLRTSISSDSATSTSPHFPPPFQAPDFSFFHPATIDEVSALLAQSPVTSCDLDPIPTTLLKLCKSALIPTITNIINLSLASGVFPDNFKSCSVHPLLKKLNLDKENLSNYRPISHLSFISKLTERLVKNRLMEHLSQNNLLNPFQSAYTKFHSTETTLLYIHDCIIRAISQQQVTGLCLLDLSAAFDTIDHSILLERLTSWFGINNTALSWIKSYLSSRSFSVKINDIKSSYFQLFHGVPQGSVLGPLLFILYTTPLSSIISRTSVNHKLYADDTQLFLSFPATNFEHNIQLLQKTISEISSWMASNFLSLNPSKTEFLLIGLPLQLAKINNPTISISNDVRLKPVSSARNLGVIFDSNLSLSEHISYISKNCFAHIRDLRRIRNTLNQTTACTIATSLIHSKLDYCNSLFLNITTQQLNRLQLIQNSAARAVVKFPKFQHITPILKSFHWLKINQRIQYKILSLTYKSLQNHQPSTLRDLLTVQQTRSTRSSDVVTLQRPANPSRLQITDRSFYHHAPALWNNLPKTLRCRTLTSNLYTENHPGLLILTPPQFHKQLKTHLFQHSYPP